MKKNVSRLIAGMLAVLMIFLSVSNLGVTALAYDNMVDSDKDINFVKAVSANEVVVTFDVNGGKDIYASKIIVEKGKTLAYSGYSFLPETKRDGYDFKGWFTEDDKEFTVDTIVTKSITVKAKWSELLNIKYHNIEYVLDGGEVQGTTSFSEVEEIMLAKPVKAGYGFEGWYLDKDFKADSKITKIEKGTTTDITVYAKWKAYTYTVSFNGGDGGKGSMNNQTLTYDKSEPLRKNLFSKTGYKFKCWSVSSNMIQKFVDSEDVVNIIAPEYDGQVITLVANWTKGDDTAEYFVKYYNVINGKVIPFTEVEKGKYSVKDNYTYNSLLVLPDKTKMKKVGYIFGGWYTDRNCRYKAKITNKTNKNLKLYAKWDSWKYNIVFNKNKGKGTSVVLPVLYGEDVTIPEATVTRKGYTFGGWASSKKLATKGYAVVKPGDSVKPYVEKNIYKDNQKLKLYAIWLPNTYKITYSTGIGKVDNSLTQYDVGSKYTARDIKNKATIIDVPKWVTVENNFKGWYLNQSYTKKGLITAKTTGDVTMYAKWKFNYRITFDKNFKGNDAGEMPDKTFAYNVRRKITGNKFTRPGYGFLGWAVVSGNGCSIKTGVSANSVSENDIVFANKQKINNFDMNYLTMEKDGPVLHLVAVWGKSATVTFKTNGGTLKEQKGVSYNGIDYVLRYNIGATMTNEQLNNIHVPVKDSYTFAGWYLEPECITPAEITKDTVGNAVFYAKWAGQKYKIVFDSNDHSGKTSTQSIAYGSSTKLKNVPFKKTGYTFKGWAVSANGAVVFENKHVMSFERQAVSANYLDADSISKTYTLYAIWEPVVYEAIVYDVNLGESYLFKYTIDTGLDIRYMEEKIQSIYPTEEYKLKGIYSDKKLTKYGKSIPKGKKGSSKAKVYYTGWSYSSDN